MVGRLAARVMAAAAAAAARAVCWRQRFDLAVGGRGLRVSAVFHWPTDMVLADRLMLYALVRGLRPSRVLEIGSRWGGSARISCAALQDNDHGRMVGLDPETRAFKVPPRLLYGRFTLVEGRSPQDVPRAVGQLGGPPDLVFIDALHIRDAVLVDIQAAVAVAAPGAHILLHDAFHPGVHRAATMSVERFGGGLVDLGVLTRHCVAAAPVCYQGLRLLRLGAAACDDDLQEGFGRIGVQWPQDLEAVGNFDRFAMRVGLVREVDGELVYEPDGPGGVKGSPPAADGSVD